MTSHATNIDSQPEMALKAKVACAGANAKGSLLVMILNT